MDKEQFNDIEDKELLARFYTDGNNEWLGILFSRYTLLLLGVCMKYFKNEEDAKDGVQQIFMKAIAEINKYKVTYFKSWIYMVSKNHCLMRLRDNKNRATMAIDEAMVADELTGEKLQEYYQKDLTLSLIEEGLQLLNTEQKQCLTLFYLQQKSYQQITSITGFTILQVKSFIQNGKRNLKVFVDKKMKQVNGYL